MNLMEVSERVDELPEEVLSSIIGNIGQSLGHGLPDVSYVDGEAFNILRPKSAILRVRTTEWLE